MDLNLSRVLISDTTDPCCKAYLEQNGIQVDSKTGLSKEQLIEEVAKYDGLIVRSATKVTAEVINSPNCRLKIIGRAGTGMDNIDLVAATNRGILVMNAPGGNTNSAVEHTCFMMGCIARSIPQADATMKQGRWDRKLFMGSELKDKTLVILGLGRIGREVAIRMQSFGMKCLGFDPMVSTEEAKEFGVQIKPLDQLLAEADYITVHTPLIPQTKGLINEEALSKCKDGVKIINCARGGIVDEDALLRGLESGKVGGAGFDVFVEEPPKNQALSKHPKVIATPHLGASTTEAQSRVAKEIAEQFVGANQGKSLVGVVNAPSLLKSADPQLQPYISLATKLGSFVGSLSREKLYEVILTGDVMTKQEALIISSLTYGLLSARCVAGVNMINATALAKNNDIVINIVKGEGPSSISVRTQSIQIEGVATHGAETITSLNGEPVAFIMKQHILYLTTSAPAYEVLSELNSCLKDNIKTVNIATNTLLIGLSGEVDPTLIKSDKISSVKLIKV